MEKVSSRALITNSLGQVYLVVHNYINPKNTGKWSTVGGRLEKDDLNELEALKREIKEELGDDVFACLEFGEKLGVYKTRCELNGKDWVTHHFFHCQLKQGDSISPWTEQSEIIEGRFFNLDQVQELDRADLFLLGCEVEFIGRIKFSD